MKEKNDKKAFKEAIKEELRPYILALKEAVKDGTKESSELIKQLIEAKQTHSEIVKKENGTEVLVLKGPKGDQGDAGKDAIVTKELIEEITKAATPVFGVHYKNGTDGVDGKDAFISEEQISEWITAATPIKGIHYRDGKDGVRGQRGQKGLDGTEISAEEVRDKLESLTGAHRLSIKAIKGLEEALNSRLGGGDGGIGGSGTTIGATLFTELTDVPATYVGQAGKVVVVKGDETGLAFTAEGLIDDHKMLVSGTDTTAGYLYNKVFSDTGNIIFAVDTPAGDENLNINVNQEATYNWTVGTHTFAQVLTANGGIYMLGDLNGGTCASFSNNVSAATSMNTAAIYASDAHINNIYDNGNGSICVNTNFNFNSYSINNAQDVYGQCGSFGTSLSAAQYDGGSTGAGYLSVCGLAVGAGAIVVGSDYSVCAGYFTALCSTADNSFAGYMHIHGSCSGFSLITDYDIQAPFFWGDGSHLTNISAQASACGSTTEVQYRDSGTGFLAGQAGFYFDPMNSVMHALGITIDSAYASGYALYTTCGIYANDYNGGQFLGSSICTGYGDFTGPIQGLCASGSSVYGACDISAGNNFVAQGQTGNTGTITILGLTNIQVYGGIVTSWS